MASRGMVLYQHMATPLGTCATTYAMQPSTVRADTQHKRLRRDGQAWHNPRAAHKPHPTPPADTRAQAQPCTAPVSSSRNGVPRSRTAPCNCTVSPPLHWAHASARAHAQPVASHAIWHGTCREPHMLGWQNCKQQPCARPTSQDASKLDPRVGARRTIVRLASGTPPGDVGGNASAWSQWWCLVLQLRHRRTADFCQAHMRAPGIHTSGVAQLTHQTPVHLGRGRSLPELKR